MTLFAAALGLALLWWPGRPRIDRRPTGRAVARGGRRTPSGGGRRGARVAAAEGSGVDPARIRRLAALAACGAAATAVGAVVTWPVAVATALITATGRRLIRRLRAAGRRRSDMEAMAAAIRALIRELDAGAATSEALEVVIRNAPGRISALLTAVRGDITGGDFTGGDLTGGVGAGPPGAPGNTSAGRAAAADDVAAIGMRLRAAWRLSVRCGIPLAGVLQALDHDVADQAQALQARAAEVAGPAMSGYVLAALPLAGLALGAGMGANPVTVLTGSALGGALLVVGVGLGCGGLIWADRIVRGARHA